jgi:hypothetical protein
MDSIRAGGFLTITSTAFAIALRYAPPSSRLLKNGILRVIFSMPGARTKVATGHDRRGLHDIDGGSGS